MGFVSATGNRRSCQGDGTIISVQADIVGAEKPRSAINVDRESARLIAISTARSRETTGEAFLSQSGLGP